MTATDELRRMLDERGVEWAEYGDGYTEFCTRQVVDGERHYTDVRHYTVQPNVMGSLIVAGLTPEQAIEATLGPRKQPPYDELIDALRRDWDIEASWDGLRKFWYIGLTDEGVRKRDEREATLGRGTCCKVLDFDGTAWVCSKCGEHIGPRRWNFCPNCGRKVVSENEQAKI